MTTDALDAAVKTRVSPDQKIRLEQIAAERHLKLSDILREAIREKIERAEAEARDRAQLKLVV